MGPIMLETAFKHYLDRKAVTKDSGAREEFLFDETFVVVKRFLEIASKHTVEELQAFSQAKTPSPPWVLTHHVLVPMPTCTIAADYLVKALGGEQKAKEMCGGTKWWTVRMQGGVECEWIGIKKDIMEEEDRVAKRHSHETKKAADRTATDTTERKTAEAVHKGKERDSDTQSDDKFCAEMDTQRCMLYIHGGAYYWGSINTHRYSIWRHARKSRGRAFACNYRKAPQYPFPCALMDVLASYIFLIRPPPGAEHRPVDPKRLTVAGDSAGGGLVLSLLQVLRDVGLPLPAGAVLISPWCDLTHSFPSVMGNTSSDIIPPYGFIHKPSILWPPPPPQLSEDIQSKIKDRVREAVQRLKHGQHGDAATDGEGENMLHRVRSAGSAIGKRRRSSTIGGSTTGRGDTRMEAEEGSTLYPASEKATHHQPHPDQTRGNTSTADPASHSDIMSIVIDGQETTIRSQIQLYATNSQLAHPYVSPALGNLGGLCPLLVIASDKEVLRDEAIYIAHKAAQPDKYPVREGVKDLLPSLRAIGEVKSTQVHLQLYDDTCHVLPLFSMCEPAKHCYRAIASFIRHVTLREASELSTSRSSTNSAKASTSSAGDIVPPTLIPMNRVDEQEEVLAPKPLSKAMAGSSLEQPPGATAIDLQKLSLTDSPEPSIRNIQVDLPSRSASFRSHAAPQDDFGTDDEILVSSPVDAPQTKSTNSDFDQRFPADEVRVPRTIPQGHAGFFGIYANWTGDQMLRERVSRKGVCRPLEEPSEIPALHQPLDEIGVLREGPVKRYLQGQALWDERFKGTTKRIEKRRREHIEKAQNNAGKAMKAWKDKVDSENAKKQAAGTESGQFLLENEFSWTWALQGENPPPTAIIARRDTPEWRNLALQADRMTDTNAHLNGLSLWTAVAGFFSKDTSTSAESSAAASPSAKRTGGGANSRLGALFGKRKAREGSETQDER